MSRFKIASVGWNCADWMEQTLRSVAHQELSNWDIHITYDPSDDNGAEFIQGWCGARDSRWQYTINTERKFATRNHYESIAAMSPADDDIVIFLDLDGDMLAHPQVLNRLGAAYAAGALVTYGQYRPVPDQGTSSFAQPYPKDVVKRNAYREHHRKGGDTCFNHLRTMSGRVFNSIPVEMFKWQHGGSANLPDGPFSWKAGSWYEGSTDYLFVINALELAGGRYHCFDEVLLLYNHANPLADNKTHPYKTHVCITDFFRRPPLAPLSPTNPRATSSKSVVEPSADPTLSAEARREVLRQYGQRFNLRTLIETGTNDGATPWALKDAFDAIYTIELGDKQWREAVQKFRRHPHVHCLQGDSTVVLPQALAKVTGPALLWLDGHTSGGDTARGDKDTPILEELDAIFATGVPHVIIIDDARLFGGMSHYGEWDWPHIDEIRSRARDHGYAIEVTDDMVRLTPE